jgi:hypothetical protein
MWRRYPYVEFHILERGQDSSVLIACGSAARGTNYLHTARGLSFVRCAMMDDIRQQTGGKKGVLQKYVIEIPVKIDYPPPPPAFLL